MRLACLKGEGLSYYHCMSRVVNGRVNFKTVDRNSLEAERFVELMRRQEANLARMFDVTIFSKELKGRFAQWYKRRHERYGVLWADRFKSVLVGGAR